ncbi:BLUF domain-containing protein [Sphingobium sp. SCG-1]|uniref:BLUF domain-containing protein n=1 Tax=Sphingobium sp. SCG-1 TaxID=2072936 RepID=UPI00166FCCC0|nr:BLUF domain-containing protein [Sphingobium sp. SCG-1]
MRQIVYLSKATIAGDEADLAAIFDQSRHNNAIDGVTGLLWFEGGWFLQAFEGPAESVAPTFARIRADTRHTNITILVDRPISQREFGTWTMGRFRPGEEADDDAKMKRLLINATDEVSGLFLKMLERTT